MAHEYLGESVEGKTVFVADDIVASATACWRWPRELKQRGAARIIADATFPLFTAGLSKFDAAVEEGVLDFMVGTNLTYRKPRAAPAPLVPGRGRVEVCGLLRAGG